MWYYFLLNQENCSLGEEKRKVTCNVFSVTFLFPKVWSPWIVLLQSSMWFTVETSQELRMLSSVTINCQVRMMDWIQVLNCQNCTQCLKCRVSRTVFCHQKSSSKIVITNCHQNCWGRWGPCQKSRSKIEVKNWGQNLRSKIEVKIEVKNWGHVSPSLWWNVLMVECVKEHRCPYTWEMKMSLTNKLLNGVL